MNHSEHILELLKKHTAQHPMRGDDLVKKLGIDPDEINDLLDDLQGRGALNRADITRPGHSSFTALWPTGLTPRNTSWKQERDNSKGFSRMAAHNAQAAAEASRTATKPAPVKATVQYDEEPYVSPYTPPAKPQQETAMVRATRPAAVVETPETPRHPPRPSINTGEVQTAILDALRDNGEMDIADIFAACQTETTLGSVGKTLEKLAQRGLVIPSIKFHNKRHRRFYRLADASKTSAPRKVDAVRASPRPTTATTATTAMPVGCGEQSEPHRPSATIPSDAEIAELVAALQPETEPELESLLPADMLGLDLPHAASHTRWCLWDDGQLLLTLGDDMMVLNQAETQRLATYLRGCNGVVFTAAAA